MRAALPRSFLLCLLAVALTGCAGHPTTSDLDPAGLHTIDGPTPYGKLNVSVDYIN